MGINIHLKTNDGKNCLHIAAAYGHLNLCKTFIQKHNFHDYMIDNEGFTALDRSAQSGVYELVKFFADNGGDIHLKTKVGGDCLHIAAAYGHLNICKTLIDKDNFDVDTADNQGFTALHRSAKSGSYEIVKRLTDSGVDMYLKTKSEETRLHVAAAFGYLNVCELLINKHNFDVNMADNAGFTALHRSAQSGSYELVKFFVNKGTDIHLKTKGGENCFHISATYGHLNLWKTIINKHNFKMDMANDGGWTALHFPTRNGSFELVKFLVDKVTNIYAKTIAGENCLRIAARNGHLNFCKKLVKKYTFNVNLADNEGWTALHHSAHNGGYELVNFFVDMGADIHLKLNDGANCLYIAPLNRHPDLCKTLLDSHNFDVRYSDKHEWTALHCSARNGGFQLFSYLLLKGSGIYSKTKNMENVLHLFALHGHLDICKFVLDYFTNDYKDNNTRKGYMLNGKSYWNEVFYQCKTIFLHAMDVNGNTYLHLAADGNNSEVCELLLKYDTEVITLLNKKK